MVGTSGALRATVEADRIDIPPGLFCYRIDRKRFVTGRRALERRRGVRLDEAQPAAAGRCRDRKATGRDDAGPAWVDGAAAVRGRALHRMAYRYARGAIAGLGSATTPIEILHAALEAVALRFRNVYEIMAGGFRRAARTHRLRRGAAALHVWTQMMADTLGHSVMHLSGTRSDFARRGAAGARTDGCHANVADLAATLRRDDPARPVEERIYLRRARQTAAALPETVRGENKVTNEAGR